MNNPGTPNENTSEWVRTNPIGRRYSRLKPTIYIFLLVALASITVIGGVAKPIDARVVESTKSPVGHLRNSGPIGYLPIVSTSDVVIVSTKPLFGVNFISSAEDNVDEQQYQNGLATGATWNRWPMYWFNIEQSQGAYNWTSQDNTVIQDLAHGLEIDAILLGTPYFYTTSSAKTGDGDRAQRRGPIELKAPQAAAPVGLYDPIFTDGTDVPGPGKSINPGNVWARFVFEAVRRYKPGGVLAQAYGWPSGRGVTHWEIWNEPDLPWFWDSSVVEYARLLKVGYLVVHQADPSASVLLGGLANIVPQPVYYEDILNTFDADPMAVPYGYFHDILATHSYFNSWNSWFYIWDAVGTMSNHGLDKPIWLNESGVPAWNDYPGPVWDPQSGWRATMSEQADYIIQSAFYATFAGADAIFHFQLYDGCGNQPAGTDFPPHNGELCELPEEYPICAGDAFGLYRNPTNAACFTQHPQPETPRPYLKAFQVLTSYFTDVEPLWRLRPGGSNPYNGPQEWIAFYRSSTNTRIVGLWSRVGESQTAVIDAVATSGLILRPDGSTQIVYPSGGKYTLHLPAATNQNDPYSTEYAIGGSPLVLIEPAL